VRRQTNKLIIEKILTARPSQWASRRWIVWNQTAKRVRESLGTQRQRRIVNSGLRLRFMNNNCSLAHENFIDTVLTLYQLFIYFILNSTLAREELENNCLLRSTHLKKLVWWPDLREVPWNYRLNLLMYISRHESRLTLRFINSFETF